jgi:hypothetical protein
MTSKTTIKPKEKGRLRITMGYRYNIKARLSKLPYSEKNKILNHVYRKCNTDRYVISRYLNELKGSKSHSNVDILRAFAERLGCTIDELIND